MMLSNLLIRTIRLLRKARSGRYSPVVNNCNNFSSKKKGRGPMKMGYQKGCSDNCPDETKKPYEWPKIPEKPKCCIQNTKVPPKPKVTGCPTFSERPVYDFYSNMPKKKK